MKGSFYNFEKKVRVDSWLENEEGERIEIEEISKHIQEHLKSTSLETFDPVYSLISSFQGMAAPSCMQPEVAACLFAFDSLVMGTVNLGLQISLLMNYIHQNNLQICSEEVSVSEAELQAIIAKNRKLQEKLLGLDLDFEEQPTKPTEYEN